MTTTLQEAMDHVATIAQSYGATHEQDCAYLHLYSGERTVQVAALDQPSLPECATMARLFVDMDCPDVAVVALEFWTVAPAFLGADSPELRAVRDGAMRVSDLPAPMRGEALVVYGETPRGDSALRVFTIHSSTGGTRRHEEQPVEDPTGSFGYRFHPLYLVEDLVRHGYSDAEARRIFNDIAQSVIARGQWTAPMPALDGAGALPVQ